MRLDYVVRPRSMFFGSQKGYFSKFDIDVTAIQRGTGSPTRCVLSAMAMLNSASGTCRRLPWRGRRTCRRDRGSQSAQSARRVALANKHKLTKPQILQGLDVGVQPSGSTYVLLKAFLASNGTTTSSKRQVAPPSKISYCSAA